MTTRDDDDCDTMFICSSHDDLMLFSNLGRVYKLKAYEIPEGSRTSKGLNIINLISLMEGEKITKIIKVPHSEKTQFINMVTKNGIIKRSYLEDYKNIRRNGLTALKMYENDELSFVAITEGESNLLIATHEGFAIRFAESSIRPIGRTGHGVRAIKLRENDYVIGMAVEEEGKDLLTIGEKGFGRITSFDSYTLQSRGGKGKINYKTEKNGYVAGICTADDNLDIIMMSNNGIIIRTPISAIPKSAGRSSKGVIVMRFKEENDRILQIATVEKAEDPIDAIEPPAENTEIPESADTNTEE